jgi:hypothetical protein
MLAIGLLTGCAEEAAPLQTPAPPVDSQPQASAPEPSAGYEQLIIGKWGSDKYGVWEFGADGSLTVTQPGMTTNGKIVWDAEDQITVTGQVVTKRRTRDNEQTFIIVELDDETLKIKYPDDVTAKMGDEFKDYFKDLIFDLRRISDQNSD